MCRERGKIHNIKTSCKLCKELASKLICFREKAKLSQDEIAALLGMRVEVIKLLEEGKGDITVSELKLLANLMGESLVSVMGCAKVDHDLVI